MNTIIILTWDDIGDVKIIKDQGKPLRFRTLGDAEKWSDENDSEFGGFYKIIELGLE